MRQFAGTYLFLVASVTSHFQVIASVGTVPAANAVPTGDSGVRFRTTACAAAVYVIVITPVLLFTATDWTALVALGAVQPSARSAAPAAAFSAIVFFAALPRTKPSVTRARTV